MFHSWEQIEQITISATELDTFIWKFHQLWNAGLNAHLNVKTHAGNAWLTLHLDLGHALEPLGSGPQPQHVPVQPAACGGPTLLRRQRRAVARRQADEKTNKKAEKADFDDNEIMKTAAVSELTDEVCDDNFYNNGYETSENYNEFINEISVEAEGGDNLNEESLKNILEKVGIGILNVRIDNEACVRIKKSKRKILEGGKFPLRVTGLKIKILSPG